MRRRFDALPAQLGILGPVGLALPRDADFGDGLAEHQQRFRHAGNLVAAADRNRNIGLAVGNAAHGAAQQRQPADDAAPDIEPGDQAGRRQRGDAQDNEKDAADADLRNGAARQRLREFALPLDRALDGLAQARRLRGRRGIDLSGILLAVELVGALRDDAVAAGDGRELLIKHGNFLGLLGLRQRFQIAFDAALRRRYGVAHRRQIGDVRHHRGFDQQPGQKIGARLDFQKPAQRLDRLIHRGAAACRLIARHQVEIGVVDGRRDRVENIFVDFPHRKRERAALRRNLEALGDRLVERVEPLDHGGARHFDLLGLAGIELAQPDDPVAEHLRLRGDIAGDLIAAIVVRRRHQARRGGDQRARLLGEAERFHGRRHAARDDFRHGRADIGRRVERKQRADHGHAGGKAERQIKARADRIEPGQHVEPAANAVGVRFEQAFSHQKPHRQDARARVIHCPAILASRVTGLNVPSACRMVKKT